MRSNIRSIILLLFLVAAVSIQAQQGDITVGKSDIPPLNWGEQKATFELTNNTDALLFIRARVGVAYEGVYLNPQRESWSNSYLEPFQSKTISARYDVPGNFGQAIVTFDLFSVVDTLDPILTGQKFFEKPIKLEFAPPDGMKSYSEMNITLPPRVNEYPGFDHEFSRNILVMLNDGMSEKEIADAAGIDSSVVGGIIDELINKRYVRAADDKLNLEFPVISKAEAEESLALALKTADLLANQISENVPGFVAVRDSLVKAGAVSADKDEFMNGGTILYHHYPVIGGLLLWGELGERFITRSAPLLIYDATDPCNATIPYYMYAVVGGDQFNGSHFWAMWLQNDYYMFNFGDSIPELDCKQIWTRRKYNWNGNPRPIKESTPEMFMIDTLATNPAISALSGNIDQSLGSLYNDLFAIAKKHGHKKLLFGHRYWFWNLVATRTMEKLVESGQIKRTGNGQFRLDGRQSIGLN